MFHKTLRYRLAGPLNKFKHVLKTSAWLRPTMSDVCWHAFEHSFQGNTGIWLKGTENNKKLCR